MRTTLLFIVVLLAAITGFCQTEAILIKRVDSLSALKEVNKADTTFIRTTAEKVLTINPKNSKAYLLLSRVAVVSNKFEQALSYVNYAIIFDKNYTDAYALRAPLLMYYQKIPEALDDYTVIINNKAGKASTYYERGYLLALYQKWEPALQDFIQAIKLDSTQAIYYSRAAAMSLNTGKQEQAIQLSTKSIQLDNKDYEPFSLRGQVYYDKKEWDSCCADFKMALDRISDDSEDDHAIRTRTAILGKTYSYCDTSSWVYYYTRGAFYFEKNDLDKAIEWYGKGTMKFPANYSMAYWLANCWNSKGDYSKAEFNFSKGIALKNNLPLEMDNISSYKNVADGKDYMTKLIAKNYQSRAEARYRLNNYSGALADINVAIEMSPKSGLAYYVRGQIKIKLEQSDYCYDFLKAKQLGYADEFSMIEQLKCK